MKNQEYHMTDSIKDNITLIILTFNEADNILKALDSLVGRFSQVMVVDSFSSDKTIELIESNYKNVVTRKNKFITYKQQRLWAVENDPFNNDWIFFLDADECVTQKLFDEIVDLDGKVNGYEIYYEFYFLGKRIKHGSYGRNYILRLFRKDAFRISRDMNEHIFVQGDTVRLKNPFIHQDNKPLHNWFSKHIDYAEREALELVNPSENKKSSLFGSQAEKKRWIRSNIWNKLPVLIRPILYFFYRFILRFGFLDGVRGLIFHFFHSFIYYFIIDSLFLEKKYVRNNRIN